MGLARRVGVGKEISVDGQRMPLKAKRRRLRIGVPKGTDRPLQCSDLEMINFGYRALAWL